MVWENPRQSCWKFYLLLSLLEGAQYEKLNNYSFIFLKVKLDFIWFYLIAASFPNLNQLMDK